MTYKVNLSLTQKKHKRLTTQSKINHTEKENIERCNIRESKVLESNFSQSLKSQNFNKKN